MDEAQIRYLGDVQRLALAPGDVVVIKTGAHLSMDAIENLRAFVAAQIPGHKILVLPSGIAIGVVGEAA